MKIWITTDKNCFLTSYSSVEQPELVEVTVDKEPTDFTNWKLEENKLVYDPLNAPEVEESLTEIEILKKENEDLKKAAEEQAIQTTDMQLAIAEVYEMLVLANKEAK